MAKEKRKSLRRPVRYSAWVALGGEQLHRCVLSDVSETGGRLDIDDSQTIPDNFTLLLASNGSARRNCHVVWRKPRQIGVTFKRRPAQHDRATLVPKPEHHMDAVNTSTAAPETVVLDSDPVKN